MPDANPLRRAHRLLTTPRTLERRTLVQARFERPGAGLAARSVLVIDSDDGQSRSALAAVQALQRGGYRPVVATTARHSLAAASRASAARVVIPSVADAAFAPAIRSELTRPEYLCALPSSDAALRALDHPGREFLDKVELARRAAAAGLDIVQSRHFPSWDALVREAETVAYPAVIKAVTNADLGWPATRVDHPADVYRLEPREGGLLVQPWLTGGMHSVAGVLWHGRPVALVHQRYLRTWPVDCGVSCAAVTVEPVPDLERRLVELLAGYDGIWQAQFVGERLIDLNPRVYGSLTLAVAAGANLPAVYCDLRAGLDPPLLRSRPGVRYHWLEGELRHVAVQVSRGAMGLGEAVGVLAPDRRAAYSAPSLGDPGPVLARARHMTGRVVHDRPGALGGTVSEVEPSLAEEWDALADRVGSPPWLRPGWIDAWWRAFGSGTLECVTVRRGARLVAVAALGRRADVLASASNWHTPSFGLVAEDEAARHRLAELLFRSGPRRVSMRFVPAESPDVQAFRAAAGEAGYGTLGRVLERSPYVACSEGWAAYEERLGAKLLRDLRRRRRGLAAQGQVETELLDGTERLEELLDAGFAVEASSWKGARGTAISSSPATESFYRTVARWAAARGWLRLAFLRLDARPLAFDFAIELDGVHYLLKTGYDPSYARSAPGKLLRLDLLARAFDSGLERYELLGSDEPWKREWAFESRELLRIDAFRGTMLGAVEQAAFAYGRPAARRLLAMRRR